jgi:hypothetical protein
MRRTGVVLALAVGIAGPGLFTACRTMSVAGGTKKGKKDIDVNLAMKDGVCQVREPVDDLGGPKGRKISWTVKNIDCPTAQYVTFGDYKPYKTGGGFGAVDHDVIDPDLAASGPVPVNTTGPPVKGKIAKEAKGTDLLFKYQICVAAFGSPAKCLDPDVDIWP